MCEVDLVMNMMSVYSVVGDPNERNERHSQLQLYMHKKTQAGNYEVRPFLICYHSVCFQETKELDMYCLDLDTWTWTHM